MEQIEKVLMNVYDASWLQLRALPLIFVDSRFSVMGNACSEGCFGMLGGAMQKELRACKKDPQFCNTRSWSVKV